MEQKSSFRLIFGDSPIVKVMDFFLDNREFDYSLTEIARKSDIGWSTLHGFWKDFVKFEVVTKTRRIGRAELYKLNLKSPIVQRLIEIDNEVSKKMMHSELEQQKIRIKSVH